MEISEMNRQQVDQAIVEVRAQIAAMDAENSTDWDTYDVLREREEALLYRSMDIALGRA